METNPIFLVSLTDPTVNMHMFHFFLIKMLLMYICYVIQYSGETTLSYNGLQAHL